jgi:hypothetical protein
VFFLGAKWEYFRQGLSYAGVSKALKMLQADFCRMTTTYIPRPNPVYVEFELNGVNGIFDGSTVDFGHGVFIGEDQPLLRERTLRIENAIGSVHGRNSFTGGYFALERLPVKNVEIPQSAIREAVEIRDPNTNWREFYHQAQQVDRKRILLAQASV